MNDQIPDGSGNTSGVPAKNDLFIMAASDDSSIAVYKSIFTGSPVAKQFQTGLRR